MAVKTVIFWVQDLTSEHKKLLADITRKLGEALRATICEWLRLAMAGEPLTGKISNKGRDAGRRILESTEYSNDLLNHYAHADAYARFKIQWKAIQRGERSSVSFPGDAPFIYLLCGYGHVQIEKVGDDWYLTKPRLFGGRTKKQRERNEALRWRLDPVDNRRSGWCLHVMSRSKRFCCVRLIPSDTKPGKWLAKITVELPDEPQAGERWGHELVAGVDLGVNCPAVLSIPDKGFARFLGRNPNEYPRLYGKIRDYEEAKRRLNRAGHKREARDLRPKLTALRQYVNECVSKQVVDLCLAQRVSRVRMENLKGMPKAPTGRLRYWPRYHLQQRIEQKLTAAGIVVEYVQAARTSTTCSVCGARGNRSGTAFECAACGWRQHADLNAANNIARKLETFGLPAHATAPEKLAGRGQAGSGENPSRAVKPARRLLAKDH